MSQSLSELLHTISELQDRLDEELKERGQHLRYELKNRRVVFEQEVLRAHREFRTHLAR
jgi:hypothetical protein